MSHCLGVMCANCHAVLVSDDICPECPDGGYHGYGLQERNAWALKTWPDHEC